jgi:hypothetical protein
MAEDHAHCPYDCEHPQPIRNVLDGKLYCGRCWIVDNVKSEMVPCTPATCPGERGGT